MEYDVEGLQELASAVIMQACKDFNNPVYTEEITRWITEGNIFTQSMLPTLTTEQILKGFKEWKGYGNKKK